MDVAWHNKGNSFYFPSIQSKLKEKVSIFFSSSLMLTSNNGFIISTLKVLLGCTSRLFILPSSLLSVFWVLQIFFNLSDFSIRIMDFLSTMSAISIMLDFSTCCPKLTFLLFP